MGLMAELLLQESLMFAPQQSSDAPDETAAGISPHGSLSRSLLQLKTLTSKLSIWSPPEVEQVQTALTHSLFLHLMLQYHILSADRNRLRHCSLLLLLLLSRLVSCSSFKATSWS